MCICLPQRLVMAFEMAKAVGTPFPQPDISSPSNSFANLSFIISISTSENQNQIIKYRTHHSEIIDIHRTKCTLGLSEYAQI